MAKKKTKKKKKGTGSPWAAAAAAVAAVVLLVGAMYGLTRVKPRPLHQVERVSMGIDVAKYQGTIDWDKTAQQVDFVMVRLGYRTLVDGIIREDSNARYNLQEASRRNVAVGGYFFSCAVSEAEAIAEADWVASLIDGYPITYPIAYDCEGFLNPDYRHSDLTPAERTDVALAFLKRMEEHGYEAMFYGSKSDMERGRWEMDRIEGKYKVWLAHYTDPQNPEAEPSSYSGPYQIWQYSQQGTVAGIRGPVDLNIAWFAYEGIAMPKGEPAGETVGPDPEAMMEFTSVWEHVTAKEVTNLRDVPSQDDSSRILYALPNGEVCMRTGVSDSGWSRLIYEGVTCYALTSYLTTDLLGTGTEPTEEATGEMEIQTQFREVDDLVTAKDAVNLRTIPSVTDPASQVVIKLSHGEVVRRTGINEDVGWSRVEYNGQILYCVTSYLETVTD